MGVDTRGLPRPHGHPAAGELPSERLQDRFVGGQAGRLEEECEDSLGIPTQGGGLTGHGAVVLGMLRGPRTCVSGWGRPGCRTWPSSGLRVLPRAPQQELSMERG